MAFDRENLLYFVPEEKRLPEGHIAMPGRADIADCLHSPNGALIEDVEKAIGMITIGMSEFEEQRFSNTVVRAFETE